MSKLTRTLMVAATLATISLAGTTTLAHAQATDQPSSRDARRPPTQGQVGEAWHRRSATSPQKTTEDATLGRVLAPERFSVPDATPAQPTTPAPIHPNGPPAWLLVSIGALALLMLMVGLAFLAARRASRRAPPPAPSPTQ